MLILPSSGSRLFLVVGPTDLRKSFNGLAGVVRNRLDANPLSRDFYFFCNRARNRLKILVSDESGVWIYAKRLERGTFAWPMDAQSGDKIEYRPEQISMLLHGVDADHLRPRGWKRRTA